MWSRSVSFRVSQVCLFLLKCTVTFTPGRVTCARVGVAWDTPMNLSHAPPAALRSKTYQQQQGFTVVNLLYTRADVIHHHIWKSLNDPEPFKEFWMSSRIRLIYIRLYPVFQDLIKCLTQQYYEYNEEIKLKTSTHQNS